MTPQRGIGAIPYDTLHIYEIDGRIDSDERGFAGEYIGVWWEGDHSFVFFSRARDEAVQSMLEDDPTLHLINRFTINYRDWQGGDEIRSFRVGKLLFSPPWESVPPSKDDLYVTLDPSVVFGTGLHDTTRDCLGALWRIYQQECPQRVIDLGTGTGILALACAKLGAQSVLAVDRNPLAVKTAMRNVRLNGEEGHILVIQGEADQLVQRSVDLICGNLPYAVIDRLLSGPILYDKRWVILSGFFRKHEATVIQRLKRHGIRIDTTVVHGPWRTLIGFNPARNPSGRPLWGLR
jgi:ribosomal protein L11 methyltransferase